MKTEQLWVGILLVGISLIIGAAGCDLELSSAKALPAPLSEVLPYEFDGNSGRLWGADHFEINDRGTIHFVILENVVAPKTGQAFSKESRGATRKLFRRSALRIVISDRDEFQREIGNVYVNELDVSLELIRQGMVWVNFAVDDTNTDLQKQYLLAQSKARESKIGLWSKPNPVHPSEFNSIR